LYMLILHPKWLVSCVKGCIIASLDRKCLGGEMSGGVRMLGRRIFDEETGKKPLAVAADAAAMEFEL